MTIRESRSRTRHARATYLAAAILGELHDFDEARRHYAAAIEAIDKQVKRAEDTKLLTRAGNGSGRQHPLRRHIEWGVLRLRSMLQIGLTYERSRNYEQALAEYRNAATFSRVLWFAMLDNYARGNDDDSSRPDGDPGLRPS